MKLGRSVDRCASVHPRACGERVDITGADQFTGSSPRLRGNGSTNPTADPVHPRACGERGRAVGRAGPGQRFIPAPAGNGGQSGTMTQSPVHPRACGERYGTMEFPDAQVPVHPRACGERGAVHGDDSGDDRFIPAPAGNGRSPNPSHVRSSVHPRACGERHIGSGSGPWFTTVHPRACGERPDSSIRCTSNFIGSSPRLRGTARLLESMFGSSPRLMTDSRPMIPGSSPRLRGTGVKDPTES